MDENLKSLFIQAKLNKILMCYNSTPCTGTNISPPNMIFAYSSKTLVYSLSKNVSFNLDSNKTYNFSNKNCNNKKKIIEENYLKKKKKYCIKIILKIL